jgi:hypothetical protein
MRSTSILPVLIVALLVSVAGGGCCRLNANDVRVYLDEYGDGENFHEYDEVLAQWRESASNDPSCSGSKACMYAANCSDRLINLLSSSDGFCGTELYFDAHTGDFIALETWSDYKDIWCYGEHYWPREVERSDCVVTEVICGDRVSVGDRVR